MNAISGPTGTSAVAQVYTSAAIQRIRPVRSNAQRAETAPADTFERSTPQTSLSSLVYGRNGRGGGGDSDGDSD